VRTAVRLAVVLLLPLTLAATDPPGDTAPCGGSNGPHDARIDLVDAKGEAIESGTAIRWTITFAEPIEVPDTEERPMRVDVLIRDPVVPSSTFDFYSELNRIVRFDDVPGAQAQIYLLPDGYNIFDGISVQGKTLTITIPSRLIVADSSFGPPVGRLRWSVVARDEGTCDFLGTGRPSEALEGVTQVDSPISLGPSIAAEDEHGLARIWLVAPVAALVLLVLGFVVARAGRGTRGS
jgi:hypothetical protein